MHKILVFDLDGTLAHIGKGISQGDIEKLRKLEKIGYRIAICSGKPTYYLCGFFRQVGLEAPIFIGENGAAVQYGVDLPPKRFLIHPHSKKAKEQLSTIKKKIEETCNGIWFQPNEIAVTPFPGEEKDFAKIQKILDENKENLSELFVYPQCDCFDITPKNISKSSGLRLLAQSERIIEKDFIAIGDGINDIPMFEFADISIGIGNRLDYKTDFNFTDISDALDFVLEQRL